MAFLGKFEGICRDNNDPLMVGRIRAEVPFPLGKGKECWSTWAMPCFAPGHFDPPKEGDGVWVEFLDGDPNRPVWTGIFFFGRGRDADDPTLAPFQEVHAALTDRDGNNVEPDNIEQDAVADAEHKGDVGRVDGGHDHSAGEFYTPHRRSWMSETGHHIEFNDHPGKDAYARFFERYGRLLEMTARGITRLRSMVSAAAIGNWRDLNGGVVDGSHSLVFADEWNDDPDNPGQYIELKDMAGARIRMQSTPGDEQVLIEDFWGQYIKMVSKSGAEIIELSDKHGNKITMENGKIVILVPDGTNVYVGDDAGGAQELATKTFVRDHFNTHTHMSAAPGSPTTPPLIPSPLLPGTDITKKQLSE